MLFVNISGWLPRPGFKHEKPVAENHPQSAAQSPAALTLDAQHLAQLERRPAHLAERAHDALGVGLGQEGAGIQHGLLPCGEARSPQCPSGICTPHPTALAQQQEEEASREQEWP